MVEKYNTIEDSEEDIILPNLESLIDSIDNQDEEDIASEINHKFLPYEKKDSEEIKKETKEKFEKLGTIKENIFLELKKYPSLYKEINTIERKRKGEVVKKVVMLEKYQEKNIVGMDYRYIQRLVNNLYKISENIPNRNLKKKIYHYEKEGNEKIWEICSLNLGLVKHIAGKFTRKLGKEFDDNFQNGTLGLKRAAEKFDYTKEFLFSSYAYTWIVHFMFRNKITNQHLVKQPIHNSDKTSKLNRFLRKNDLDLNDSDDLEFIMEKLNMDEKELNNLVFSYLSKEISLDRSIRIGNEKEDISLNEILCENPIGQIPTDPFTYSLETEYSEIIESILIEISPKEELVIKERFGIGCYPQTLEEIGNHIGVSRERVRQIQYQALEKLKKTMKKMYPGYTLK